LTAHGAIYTAIQRPTELPVVNVVALVMILISVIPVWIASHLSSESGSLGRG
jgi:putative spermidine/putrescine transport system permease protein